MADLSGWQDLDRMIEYLGCRARTLGRVDSKMQSRFSASDIVAETMARAVASTEPVLAESAPQRIAYLEKIQDNVLIDRWRACHTKKGDVEREQDFRRRLDQSSAGWEKSIADSQVTPSEIVVQKETMMRIMAAIEKLPDREREVAILHMLDGLSLGDVAKVLGLTKGVVGNLHRNVIKQLRKELDDLRE